MKIQIYRLFSENSPNFYVGSTANDLKNRFAKHRNKSHEAPNRKVYKHILENGGFNKWSIESLEEFDCNDRITRMEREQHYIDLLKPELNSVRCLA